MTIPFLSKARREKPHGTVRLFISKDAAAVAVGADTVAAAIARSSAVTGVPVDIVRTGSRGMLWLEPLVEVDMAGVRHGFGPIEPEALGSLLNAGLLRRDRQALSAHPASPGPVDKIDFLARQTRLTFARCGLADPLSLDAYLSLGGYQGLEKALALTPAGIVDEVTESGLRGRGGAAFPTGIKWKTAYDAPADQKYIVCNADEGDSGTFSDRMVMEGDPFLLIEGMTIASLAIGATHGYIYLRSEYPHAERALNEVIAAAYREGYLGADIRGSGKTFHLEVRRGAGAYICGEETALLESLEGKRGEIRYRPPCRPSPDSSVSRRF